MGKKSIKVALNQSINNHYCLKLLEPTTDYQRRSRNSLRFDPRIQAPVEAVLNEV